MMKSAKIKKYLIGISAIGAMLLSGCISANASTSSGSTVKLKKNVDGSVIYSRANGKYAAYDYVNVKDHFSYGKTPTKAEMQAWHVEILPNIFQKPGKPGSTGLPKGHGSVSEGEAIYTNKCAMCHGDFGMGGLGYPTLAGGAGTLKNQLLTSGDNPPLKTIGSYWPYVSTLYWYINTAMPFPHPKSLTHNEVYAVVAYLLSLNNITINGQELGEDYVLNRKKFLEIKMPNRDGFYPKVNGSHAMANMKTFLSNPKNWGMGSTCMHNCLKTAGDKVIHIQYAITNIIPKFSGKLDLPKVKGAKKVSYGEKIYNDSCKICHGNANMGAPVFGNKADWAKVMSKGMKKVYANAIHGVGGMPPKGGTTLTNSQFKSVVDYLVNSSK